MQEVNTQRRVFLLGALCIGAIRKYYVHLENWSSSNNRDEVTRIHFTDDAFIGTVVLVA